MRRMFVILSLVSLVGCADDSGGPRVAADAKAPPTTGDAGPAEIGKPGVAKGKGVTAPTPAKSLSGTAPLQP